MATEGRRGDGVSGLILQRKNLSSKEVANDQSDEWMSNRGRSDEWMTSRGRSDEWLTGRGRSDEWMTSRGSKYIGVLRPVNQCLAEEEVMNG